MAMLELAGEGLEYADAGAAGQRAVVLMIRRTSHILRHDASRVIAKPYLPGEEIASGDAGSRAGLLMARILALPDRDTTMVLQHVLRRFENATSSSRISSSGTSPWSPTSWATSRCRGSAGC
jgi:hypothetical protein